MSYEAMEDGLLTLIRAMPDYSSSNASQGKWDVLATGNTQAIVLMPGPLVSREVMATPRRISNLWEIEINLYLQFQTDISDIANLIRDKRQDLIDTLDAYPTLNGVTGCVSAFIIGARQYETWIGESGSWWNQPILMHIRENTTVTILE